MLMLLFLPLKQGVEIGSTPFGLLARRLDVVDVVEVKECKQFGPHFELGK